MTPDILKIGDRVCFPNPLDIYGSLMEDIHGKKGTVKRFAEVAVGYDGYGVPAGIYEDKSKVTVLVDGEEHVFYLDSYMMELDDQVEAELRLAPWRESVLKHRGSSHAPWRRFLRDLPPQPFWPGDRVRIDLVAAKKHGSINMGWQPDEPIGVVKYVSLHGHMFPSLEEYIEGIEPWYRAAPSYMGIHALQCRGGEMELLERGPFWNYYHYLTMSFENLLHEAVVNDKLGLAEEAVNEAREHGVWSPEEAVAAMATGVLDGCRQGVAIAEGYYGLRFKNRELARRLREGYPKQYNPFWMNRDSAIKS